MVREKWEVREGKRMYEDAGEQEVDGERTVPVLHRERTL